MEQDGFRARIVAGRYGPVDLCTMKYTPHELSDADANFGHSHPVSRLIIMLEGGGTVWIGKHTLDLRPGSGVLLPGNLPLSYDVSETSSRVQLDLAADDPLFATHLQDVPLAHWPTRNAALEGLAAYGRALLRYDGSNAHRADRVQARRGLESLALATLASAPPLEDGDRQAPRSFVLDYIRHHYTEPSLTTKRVAHAAGISVRTVQRIFEGERGCTEWIAHFRLQHALTLLGDERLAPLTNAEIALRSGYGSTVSMYRAVIAATGQPPAAYRRRRTRAEE